MTTEEQDRKYSPAEIAAGVQAAFALCATCSHAQSEHRDGGACQQGEVNRETGEIRAACDCPEYWEVRRETLDGLTVLAHEIGFGGAVVVELDRRWTTELWDSLSVGQELTFGLVVTAEVASKGVKAAREKGEVIGAVEVRRLRVVEVREG